LASAGYILISIDANDANCVSNLGEPGFVPERADLFKAHVDVLKNAATSSNSALTTIGAHIDLSRLLYAGHSRGAEAAMVAGFSPVADTKLRGVIAVAPPTFVLTGTRKLDAPLLVVLPAADGDVSFNGGMRYYDVTTAGANADSHWFKTQQYVFGANHNFFNSEWNDNYETCGVDHPDGNNGNGAERLSRAQQQRYLTGILRLFLDATFTASPLAHAALAGNAKIQNFDAYTVAASYAENTPGIDMPSSPTASGFSIFKKYSFAQSSSAYNETFFHQLSGYVGVLQASGASFELGSIQNKPPRYISLRVAQVANDDANSETRSVDIDIELEDDTRRKLRASSNWAGNGIPTWYERPPWLDSSNCNSVPVEKTVLGTVRIPFRCFKGDTAFSASNLKTLRIIPTNAPGALAFSDFQIIP
jgi:hypothetical protein